MLTTALGIMGILGIGLGALLGGLLGAQLFAMWGIQVLWHVGMCISIVGLLLVALSDFAARREEGRASSSKDIKGVR